MLAEWIMAFELHKRGIVKHVLPIVIGEHDKDGRYSQSFFEELRQLACIRWHA